MSDEKRKRSPILPTVKRAVALVIRAGQTKQLIVTTIWVLLGAVYSFTAVFNEKFLNSAADVITGNDGAFKSAAFWLVIWGLVEIFTSFMGVYNANVLSRMWHEVSYYVQENIMKKVCRIRLRYFDDRESQKKIRFVKSGLQNHISRVTNSVMCAIRSTITFVTACLIIVNTNWLIAVIVFVSTIPAILLESYRTEKSYELSQWQSYEGEMQGYLSRLLIRRKYIKELRFYQLYDYLEDKYDKSVNDLTKQQVKLTKYHFLVGIGTSICTYGATAASLAIIASEIFNGSEQIGAFVLIYSSVQNMQSALKSIFSELDIIGDKGRYLEDYETVMEFEEENHQSEDKADDSDCDIEIVFENVSFSYPGMNTEVLKDINLTIRPGEKIAIVGENGSGKSTFVSLLTGLYSPTKGRILINGEDISSKLGFLRERLSCTMQDYLQHQETVAENVRIGDLSHEHGNEDVRKALEKAGVIDYIDTLPYKENTYLGNLNKESTDLSGGQWQKIVMARNLYKDKAKVMLMDEPTAALDPLAESRLYSEFSELTKDKTVLLISHRLGATRLADRVLVFHDGRIVEDGAHEQLLRNGKMYAEMYNAQAQWYADEKLEL